MRILGLDPSITSFGWAVHDTEAKGRDRCPHRGHLVTNTSMLYVNRFTFLREEVKRLVQTYQPDKVSFESPIFGATWSEGAYALFCFVSEALHSSKVDIVLWTPGQIKAHAREVLDRPKIGRKLWVMTKGDMIAAAQWDTRKSETDFRARWKNDEADAYMAAVLGGRFWNLRAGNLAEDDLTPVERKQFLEIQHPTKGRKAGRTLKKGTLFRESDRFFLWSQESEPDGS